MNPIDLRSDTLTTPTDTMRDAMAQAEVGDDVFGEDPTVNRLEEIAAKRVGKEAAVFVPSGTMGNLISVLTHCARGDEVILGDQSHIFLNEVGGMSALGGIHPRTVPNEPDGTLRLQAIASAIRTPDLHHPPTRLIALENTHNYCMGSPLTTEYMSQAGELARRHGLRVHVDGARIFNAAAALSVDVGELTRDADSVMFCLSKGLSAPVGSLACGTSEFAQTARKWRKMVGGGMRQAGHLAAAGLVALNDLVDRLKEDHTHTQKLAQGLLALKGTELDSSQIKTNIIFFTLKHPTVTPERFLEGLEAEGVKILMIHSGTFRAVLHREISEDQVNRVLAVAAKLLQ
ncbi:MAG: low-specificity L-threonine aldolase [Nitrospinaceae bacterium]|nr:low-specificity L-threonine aldolase [Nitrospinaceae bacterium]